MRQHECKIADQLHNQKFTYTKIHFEFYVIGFLKTKNRFWGVSEFFGGLRLGFLFKLFNFFCHGHHFGDHFVAEGCGG